MRFCFYIFFERMGFMNTKEMTVEEQKELARMEKDRLMRMIVTFQKGNQYTLENLSGKTLKKLQSIYDKVAHR